VIKMDRFDKKDFMPAGVRKGTGVWACSKPEEHVPSPCTGRDREGAYAQQGIPPRSPRTRGEARTRENGDLQREYMPPLKAIEDIQPDDFVLGHDGKAHRVLRTILKMHTGKMIGIGHEKCNKILWLTADHRVLVRRRPRSLGGKSDWSGVPQINFERSTTMRNAQTPPEKIVWEMLRNNACGVKFRRQHPIGPYMADFYSRDARLVVEIDGKAAHSSEKAIHHDAARNELMKKMGLTVLRVSAANVFVNPDGVFMAIMNAVNESNMQKDTEWMAAIRLKKNDVVFFGSFLTGIRITELHEEIIDEPVYDLEVEDAHSFITEVCAVHNCGSGATAYAVEGGDAAALLSKFPEVSPYRNFGVI
jgi:adenine-specific DNA-methyltransferase